jgi:hypothetical protein
MPHYTPHQWKKGRQNPDQETRIKWTLAAP